MPPPVNISKVTTPPLSTKILHRPRLTTLLDSNIDRRLTLITGPGAQGKSTIASSYANTFERRRAWATLETEDSDPIQFYYTLVQALQYAFPEMDFTPRLSYPAMSLGPRLEKPLFREWTHVIFDGLDQAVWIYLDDLNMLSPDSPVFSFLTVILDEAPLNVRFILLSREIPPINFQRMKIRQLAFGLSQEDLAFTLEESKLFFKNVCGLSLSETEIKRIDSYTEGWVGGLILVADLLKRLPPEKRSDLSFVGQPEHFKQAAFQYFGEELFYAQPKMVREVLLQSAIFNFVDPDFIESFIPGIGVREILYDIAKKNLFLTAYPADGKNLCFRYHNLFREFLKGQLLSKTGQDEMTDLYKKAGGLFEERGDFENAANYYLLAKAFPQAASSIVRAGMQLVQMGKMAQVADWLKALPEQSVQENPWLLYYQSLTVRFTEARDNRYRLQKAFMLFEEQRDIAGQMLSLSFLIEASNMAGKDLTPLSSLIEAGERLIQSHKTDQYAFEKAVLLLQMGCMYSLRLWEPKKGYWASWNAYIIISRFDVAPLQIYALSGAFISQQMMGDMVGAEKTRKKIDRILKTCNYPEMNTFSTINLCQYYSLKGELTKALEHIRQGLNEAENMGLIYLMPPLHIQDMMLRPHLNDFEAAEHTGEQLIGFASSMDNDFFKGMASLFLGVSYYHKEEFVKSEALIKASKEFFSSDMAYSLTHLVMANHFLGLIHCHLGRYDRAELTMSESFGAIQQLKGTRWEVCFLLGSAFIHYGQKMISNARACLKNGFEIMEKNNIEFLMWMSLKDVAQACLLTLELKVESAVAYASYLLCNRFKAISIPELEKLSHHGDAWIKEKAVAVLTAIHRSTVPKIRLQTLYGFEVLRAGLPMKPSEWERNKAKSLLKVIIARGPGNVHKEVIIEDLWPECSADNGEKNFKVTLHRLRKSLEPAMHNTFGSCYIHLDDKRLSLDENLCEVDADHFVSLIAQGKACFKEGKPQKARKFFNEAIALYQGDFLKEDIYQDWAVEKRLKLKNLFIETLLTLGRINVGQGAWKKAESSYLKAINADPLLEEAYQQLMVLYENQDMRSQAIRLYERCKLKLMQELDVPPDRQTEAIFKRITQNISKL